MAPPTTEQLSPAPSSQRPLNLCVLGASEDTGNLGVSALAESIVSAVAGRCPSARLTLFDHGWGVRPRACEIDRIRFEYETCGLRRSRRIHRAEAMWNVRFSARLGGLRNAAARRLRSADAVLDVSAGDSFSDIYGEARFETMAQQKELVLLLRRQLILLPQTYGPFSSTRNRDRARRILQRASSAWARDRDSFRHLRELLGDDFDPIRHQLGTDLALTLRPVDPGSAGEVVRADPVAPLAGVNVSGLLFNQEAAARRSFRLIADYPALMRSLVAHLVGLGVNVLLVPHEHTRGRDGDSDRVAAKTLLDSLNPGTRELVRLAPEGLSAAETKWLIARCDWFCGARMHSTIAGLSSGVPSAAIAYSRKTAGVFEEFGLRDQAIDARICSTGEALEALTRSWDNRESTRLALARSAAAAVSKAHSQWDRILGSV